MVRNLIFYDYVFTHDIYTLLIKTMPVNLDYIKIIGSK